MTTLPPRYDARRSLGSGGMGEVWLAFDHERGEDVALKAFRPAPGADPEEGRFLFRQEFWTARALAHPNLVAAHDYGELPDGRPYFTMEYVAGADLAVDGAGGEAAARAWLPGIGAALAFLHAHGYVHGDLKPANVRLGLAWPKLMDLGLLTRSGRAGGPIRGTLAYLAPEAIRQGAVDARTDLYALGAMLYHLLAGRPPFGETETRALLHAHLERRPTPLVEVAPGVSPAFARLVDALLAKDPAHRPASVAEALAMIGLAAPGEAAATLLASPLVGRDALEGEIAKAIERPDPRRIAFAGPAGAGKTRVLLEARARAQLAGHATFAAAGRGAEAPPYQAVGPLLRALAATATPAATAWTPVLARVVPGLAATPAEALDGEGERARLHGAVAAIAREAAPTAFWLLDDADRLDPASRALVEHLRAAGRDLAWTWLEAHDERGAGILALGPLAAADVLAMARALLGQPDLPAAVAERLPELSGGLPGLVEAVLGHWVRTGALRRVDGRWAAADAAAWDLPGGLAPALDARFEALDEDARLLGRLAALLGADFPPPGLLAVSGLAEPAFFAALATLEDAEVVRGAHPGEGDGPAGGGLAFVRPAQATALAATWPDPEAQAHHAAAAAWLAGGGTPRAEDLPLATAIAVGRHLLAALRPADAAPWVVTAVERSLALGALDAADALLATARAGGLVEGAAGYVDLLALARLEARLRRLQGRTADAVALYEGAVLPAARSGLDPAALARDLTGLGVAHQMAGAYDAARAAYEEAIALADAAGDPVEGVRAQLYAGRVAYFAGETDRALARLADAVARARRVEAPALVAGALSLHGYVLASTEPARAAEGLAALDEAAAASRAIGDVVEEQEAMSLRGNVLLALGRLAAAEEAFAACRALAERTGMASELTFARLNLGAVSLERGRYADARSHARAAFSLAAQQGRRFPEGFARALGGLAAMLGGDLAGGMAEIDAGLAIARELGNKYLELQVAAYRAEAFLALGHLGGTSGAVDGAKALAAEIRSGEQDARLARLAAIVRLLEGRPDAEAAFTAIEAAARAAGNAPALAHALRWLAGIRLDAGDVAGASARAAEADRLALEAGLDGLRAELAWLLGRCAAASGDAAGAAAEFGAGVQRAQAIGHRFAELVCRVARADADPLFTSDARLAARELAQLLEPFGEGARADVLRLPGLAMVLAAAPEMAAGRVDTMHDLLAEVGAETELAAVMERAIAALVEIAGAERGFLLLYDGPSLAEQVFHGPGADAPGAFSASLAYKVYWSEEPLWIQDAQADQELAGAASVQALGLRSVLGVPLIAADEATGAPTTIGVMLADSTAVNPRFGAQDLALVRELARQVTPLIAGAKRLARARREHAVLATAARLAPGLLATADPQEAFRLAADEALAATGAERALLLWGAELTCTAARAAGGVDLPAAEAQASRTVAGWVFEGGEPARLVDAADDEQFGQARSIAALDLRTVFAAPVGHGGRTFGVLYLDDRRLRDPDAAGFERLVRIGALLGAWHSRGS